MDVRNSIKLPSRPTRFLPTKLTHDMERFKAGGHAIREGDAQPTPPAQNSTDQK